MKLPEIIGFTVSYIRWEVTSELKEQESRCESG